MKKLIFLAITAIVFTVGAFAQPTHSQVPVPDFVQKRQATEELSNQEVAKYLAMSKEGLLYNGVINLDEVYPGQQLTFNFSFEDGENVAVAHTVKDGENIWDIIKYQMADLIRRHGKPVPYVEPKQKEETSPATTNVVPATSGFWDADNIALAILFGMIAAIIIAYLVVNRRRFSNYFAERRRRRLTDNPVVPGGVSANQARTHMETLARQYFPGLNVTNIVKGRLTAKNALVSFADKLTGKTRSFENEPGYRGTLRRENGSEEYIYFLEVCGNRARQGDYFSGDIQFIADAEQPAVLQQQSQQDLHQQNANPVTFEPATIATIVSAMIEPMKGAENGKLKVKIGETEIEMEFSSNPKPQLLLTNGAIKDQPVQQVVN